MFLDVDEKQAEKEMTGCQVTMSSIVVMQRLEMYVDGRPTVVSRNGGTSSWSDDDDRSRRRPGKSLSDTNQLIQI